jgi:hypothetical protein
MVIAAFEGSLLSHATPGVPMTFTGERVGVESVLRRSPS